MTTHIVVPMDNVECFVGAMLSLLHGWAALTHTDGSLELRRAEPVPYCPQCAQDIQREHDELTRIL